MIVPMKKVSLVVLSSEKTKALQELRRLGLLHIEIAEGSGGRLTQLKEQVALLESSIFTAGEKAKKGSAPQSATTAEAIAIAEKVSALTEERKLCLSEIAAAKAELERLKHWGEVDPAALVALAEKGVSMVLYEMPASEYGKLGEGITTLVLAKTKATVRFAAIDSEAAMEDYRAYRLQLPAISTQAIREKIASLEGRLQVMEGELGGYAAYTQSMKDAVKALEKELEFETYASGMAGEDLDARQAVSVSYFTGYLPAEELDKLKAAAREHAWGLLAEDPTQEDDVPTKLKKQPLC